MSGFKTPNDFNIYINRIFERSIDLIKCRIWNGIEIVKLEKWINNFETDLEKYFAACVLDNLIYRSTPQTISLIYQIFSRNLPDLFRNQILYEFEESCIERLKFKPLKKDPLIRIVLAIRESDPLTKSAPAIGRLLKRKFDVIENWIIKPSEIGSCYSSGVRYFIFVDDFVGTGQQFLDLCDEIDIKKYTEAYFMYTPLIAHHEGFKNINDLYPNIALSSAEILEENHGIFHKDSSCFNDGTNTPDLAKMFYYEMLDKKNISKNKRRGYGDLELAIAFQHAAPDNSLKIIWYDSDDWNSLVDR